MSQNSRNSNCIIRCGQHRDRTENQNVDDHFDILIHTLMSIFGCILFISRSFLV